MEYKSSAHSVYLLTYHLVFVTKYRKPCISDEIGDFMKLRAEQLLTGSDGSLIEAESDKDHIHLLVELPPSISVSEIVKKLKTQLSKECHFRFQKEIGKYLYGEKTPLWSPSYFAATTGSTVMEKVREYINSQRTDEHHRKYIKSGKYSKKKPDTISG